MALLCVGTVLSALYVLFTPLQQPYVRPSLMFYAKNSDYTRVQLSLGSHEESLAHLQSYAGCALLPPT